MEFRDIVHNKEVLLVGNSKGIVDQGSTIDSYEFVVRFNYGIKQPIKYNTGNKCDAWVYSMKSEYQAKETFSKATIKPTYCVRFFGIPPELKLGNHIYLPRVDIYEKLVKEFSLVGRQNPSTGVSLLYYIMNECITKSVTLIGFDSFKTPNFYANRVWASEWHDSDKEAAYINKLVSENKIKII